MNHMFCCHLLSDTKREDALTIRVFGGIEGLHLNFPRHIEVKGIQVAALLGVGQPIYAIFKNGVVYRFAPGRTLQPADVTDPKVIRYYKYINGVYSWLRLITCLYIGSVVGSCIWQNTLMIIGILLIISSIIHSDLQLIL